MTVGTAISYEAEAFEAQVKQKDGPNKGGKKQISGQKQAGNDKVLVF
jgi:hypothetical protein